jgi:hypothetical protein
MHKSIIHRLNSRFDAGIGVRSGMGAACCLI